MNIRLAAIAVCLLSTTALAQTPPAPQGDAPTVPNIPDYSKLTEGQPIDGRENENKRDMPAFSHQTRAPYHKTRGYKTTEITGSLHAPWALAVLPDGKILVTERLPGALRVIDAKGTIAPPVSGLDGLTPGWPGTGLFDLALDPDFARNHQIFFTAFGWDHGMISGLLVVRATFNEASNSLSDVKIIFRAHPETPNDAHSGIGTRSGGRIAIGKDGYLYITIGDRDAGTSFPWRVAQTLDTDLGKIIRITRDGAPAPGNPFAGKEGALPEIWAIGQRSQEGLTFDASGQLWEVEHGPRGGDELNLIKPGANYGWPIISHGIDYPGPPIGDAQVTKPGMEEPTYYWAPSTAPSGLAWYDANLFPEWKGSMLVGMLRGNSLERLKIVNNRVTAEEPLLTDVHMRIRDVRVGPDGAIYVLTDGGLSSITDNTNADSKLLKLTPQ
ncbi:MAG TPA: PQQ-dependent sugar dehydrogenase [Rhizomicrobium sp.]|nr:PQQ-dependent sugar dehydrogenase [Rhizomicrobium sp.]